MSIASDIRLLRSILFAARVSQKPPQSHLSPKLRRHVSTSPQSQPPDPNFVPLLDQPARLVSTRKKTTALGIITLSLIPITAFVLGTWQVQRLDWKTKLIARFEDRLVREPLPLPPRLDPAVVPEFDYRRVYATGTFRHDKEMLIGPRMHDGADGFLVVTPLERRKGESTILVNRGWISREKRYQRDRDDAALPSGEVMVAGLLREPWKKNMFTPSNKPEEGQFHFPDVNQMAEVAGSEPVWIEETMQANLLTSWDRGEKGIPIGRAPEVNLRNTHLQYIFTW